MGFIDKAKNKAEEVAGKVKEEVGQATNNDELTAEGKADQTSAGVKQTGEDVKDGASKIADSISDTVNKHR